MRAMVIEEFGGPEKLHLMEVPKPEISDHEVLIHVAFAGVNPADWKAREGYFRDRVPHEFPIILGWDASGKIEAKGNNVKDLKIGDEVFAYVRKPLYKWGTYAEYVSFQSKDVVVKPKNLTLDQAAALPLVSLTAWQSIFDNAHLKKGETILILGGSGSVGTMAIQFAKHTGAKVIATASPQKFEHVKKFGADTVVDYHNDITKNVKDVDVVFDTVGGESFKQGLSCLKKGGRVVSILEHLDPNEARKLEITSHYVFVQPNGNDLEQIAQLLHQKKIMPLPTEIMPLEQAAQAQEKVRAGHLGKIVLKI